VKRDEIEDKAREAYKSARLSSLGIEIGVAVAFGLFIGYQVDQYFNTEPGGILGGMLVGMLAAARSVHKTLKLYALAEEAESQKQGNSASEHDPSKTEENQ
jgi:F0F1-type ATP synthase assembly protein I